MKLLINPHSPVTRACFQGVAGLVSFISTTFLAMVVLTLSAVSSAGATNIVRTNLIPNRGIAYASLSQELFVSGSTRTGPNAFRLFSLNPWTGATNWSHPMGTDLSALAVSEDQKGLWVSLPRSNSVVLLDLATRSIVREIAITPGRSSLTALQISVIPGQSNQLLILRALDRQTVGELVLYSDGVPLTNRIPDCDGFFLRGKDVFASQTFQSAARKYRIDESGLVGNENVSYLEPRRMGEFEGRVISRGVIYDRDDSTQLGSVAPVGYIYKPLVFSQARRVYHLEERDLYSHDLDTFRLTSKDSLSVPVGTFDPPMVLALEERGIAISLPNQVAVVEPAVLPSPESADLGVALLGSTDPVGSSEEFSLRILVTNRGPAAAAAVIVTNFFSNVIPRPPWVVSQGTYTNRSGRAVFNLGELAANASAEMTLTMAPVPGAVTFANSASVSALPKESDETDNVAVLTTAVRNPGDDPMISVADIAAHSLACSASRNEFYGLTKNTAGKLGNSLVRIRNGLVETNWFVGSEPNLLELSPSGDLAWIHLAGATTNLVLFDLVSGRIDGRFVVPPIRAMASPRGTEKTLVAAHAWGMAVYDNGVARSNTLQNPNFGVRFSFASDTNLWISDKEGVLHEVVVERDGLREVPHGFPPYPQVYSGIAVFGNRAVAAQGIVLDLETGVKISASGSGALMAADPMLGKAFFIREDNSAIQIVDGTTGVPLDQVSTAGLGRPVELLVANGRAAMTRGNTVTFIESPLFADHGETDLAVSVSNAGEPVVGDDFIYSVTVTNKSVLAADNVVLTIDLAGEMAWETANLPAESITTNGNFIVLRLGTIRGKSAVAVRAQGRPHTAGEVRTLFHVASNALDTDYSDNSVTRENYCSFNTTRDSMVKLKFDSVFAGVDPTTGLVQLLGRPASNAASILTTIDPATGRIVAERQVGTNATRFLHTADGRFLYVLVDGALGLQRISLRAEEPDLFVRFDHPVLDLAVKPGEPTVVAVCDGGSTMIYDGSTLRPGIAQGHNFLEFSDDGSLLFGFNSYFDTMVVTQDGVSITQRVGGLPNGGVTDFRQDGGLILTSTGHVIDPVKGKWLASYDVPFRSTPVPEFSAGRAYFVIPYLIGIYDAQSCKPIRMISLPRDFVELTEAIQLLRWGDDGLVFRSDKALLVIRAPEIPSGPAADLEVRLKEDILSTGADREEILYTIDFSNRGEYAITNAVVELRLPRAFELSNVSGTLGTLRSATNSIFSAVDLLMPGATGQLRAKVTAPIGAFSVEASITSNAREAVTWNNFAARITSVLLPFRLDNPELLPIMASDMAQSSPTGKLCVVTQSGAPNGLNCRFFTIDPVTGRMSDPIWLGFAPNKTAVSEDGRYAYAGLFPSGKLVRIDLDRGAIDLNFELPGPLTASDLAVVPGHNNWLIATRRTHSFSPDDVGALLLIDNQPAGELPERTIGVLSQGSQIWGYGGAGVGPIQANPGGLSMGSSVAPLEGVTDLEYHEGRIYTDNARVIDIAQRKIVATFQDLTFGGEVAVDPSGPGFYYNHGGYIHKFDKESLSFVTNQVIGNGFARGFANFYRWGADGFAFRSADQIYLVRSSLVDVTSTNDLDGDGMPDNWESRNGTNPNRFDAQGDLDGDGHSNLEEHLAGTNPNDLAPLRLRMERISPNAIDFAFDTWLGGVYSLERRVGFDELSIWEPVGSFTAQGSIGRFTVPVSPTGQEYFRLVRGTP